MNKRRKARRKRWLRAKVKAYRRAAFRDSFRQHFIRAGILKGGESSAN